MDQQPKAVPIGKGELLRDGADVAILAVGIMVMPALEAAERLAKDGVSAAVVNARFVKPLDDELILRLAKKTGRIVTAEEHALQAGFGSAVLELLETARLASVKSMRIGLPDIFIEHGTQAILRKKYGLDADGVYNSVRKFMDETSLKAVAPVTNIK